MGNTLGEVMEGKGEVPRFQVTNGFWHYNNVELDEYQEVRGTVERADFGRFCSYQGVLVGLSLTIKLESGFSCGWSFENLPDIQQFFNQTKSTYLNDLVGSPVIVAESGMRIRGIKVNAELVVDRYKEHRSHADSISFFTSMNKLIHEQDKETSGILIRKPGANKMYEFLPWMPTLLKIWGCLWLILIVGLATMYFTLGRFKNW